MGAPSVPLIGVPACWKVSEELPVHQVSAKYITGVVDGARGMPVLIPALGAALDMAALVDKLDGLMLTGSPSNVEPHLYDGTPSVPGTLHDPQRDTTTLPLIQAAIEACVPVFGICRGHQELNVALGGTLHQRVHELPGRLDHRSRKDIPVKARYEPAHPVKLAANGKLRRMFGWDEVQVNSLHAQAIDRTADRLLVEAVAPDGTVEAVSLIDGKGFCMGVQWHPEWPRLDDPVSKALFDAFGDACRERAQVRAAGKLAPTA
ncbi:MAG: gamma-glutamyl-gamma-aminobutyrate hydrolase family protein [Alphaproteobacteria bacterium]|nr:gamma-glutamyl-gamma-aminobutyrate hydrolase family protein [Alphaproteobacteria bacterium]